MRNNSCKVIPDEFVGCTCVVLGVNAVGDNDILPASELVIFDGVNNVIIFISFFAVKGFIFDGNKFIDDAFEKGPFKRIKKLIMKTRNSESAKFYNFFHFASPPTPLNFLLRI